MTAIHHSSDATLAADIASAPGAVLIDFWADWCVPCKMLAPILDEVAEDYEGQLRVIKINADQHPLSTARLAVRGLPSLVLLVDGVEVERLLGTVTKTRLADFLDRHLEGGA